MVLLFIAGFLDTDLGSGAYGSFPAVLLASAPQDAGLVPGEADLPLGFVRVRRFGLDFAATNCALCHAGRLDGRIVIGLPNKDLDIQRLLKWFYNALPDMNASALLARAEAQGTRTTWSEGLVFRAWLLAAKLGERYTSWRKGPPQFTDETGPGRSDAVNGWKRTLGLPVGDAVSYVDIPPIFNQRFKTRTLLDGSATGDAAARVMLTELQKGRPPESVLAHREPIDALMRFVTQELKPPPYPGTLDQALVDRGAEVFDDKCERCHGDKTGYPNKRILVEKVGTDDNRARAMTNDLRDALEATAFGPLIDIEPKVTYMPPPLDGVWATAPYLHNGAVPTLEDMFKKDRPETFYRGAFLFDTRKQGNSNRGHPFTYELPERDKPAVLEFLKTL